MLEHMLSGEPPTPPPRPRAVDTLGVAALVAVVTYVIALSYPRSTASVVLAGTAASVALAWCSGAAAVRVGTRHRAVAPFQLEPRRKRLVFVAFGCGTTLTILAVTLLPSATANLVAPIVIGAMVLAVAVLARAAGWNLAILILWTGAVSLMCVSFSDVATRLPSLLFRFALATIMLLQSARGSWTHGNAIGGGMFLLGVLNDALGFARTGLGE